MVTSPRHVAVVLWLLVAALSLPTASAIGDVRDANWNGGTGNWNVAGNWDPAVVPNNGANTYRVFIDHENVAASTVTLNMSATIDALWVDGDDALIVGDTRSLKIVGGILVNDGSVSVGQTPGNYTLLALGANATLSGTGEVILTHATYSQIRGSSTDLFRLTNEAGHTIRGTGWLGTDTHGRLAVTNQGTVDADVNGGTLTIDPYPVSDGAADFVNTGLLKARNGGTLLLTSGAFNNTGGQMLAEADSTVELATGAVVTGGTLTTTGDGMFRVTGTTASIADLTNAGKLVVADSGNSLGLKGAIVNNGSMSVGQAPGNYTLLTLGANATLSGTGEVILTNGTYSQVRGLTTGLFRLTNEAGHTIRGAGWLGTDTQGRLAVTNRGTVNADVNTKTLTIDPYTVDAEADFVNAADGMLKASNGGTLKLTDGAFNNTGGQMLAEAGSTVELAAGAVVTGGTLTTSGDGKFLATGSATTSSIADLTNAGSLVVADNASLGLKGAIVNNGSVSVGQTPGNSTLLTLVANATLSGTGEVILTHATYSQIRGSNANLFRLTNEGGHTIRGAGWLGTDIYGRLAVTNRGTVNADVAGGTLTIDPWDVSDGAADFVNAADGMLKASNGGTLKLTDGAFNNAGGQMLAEAGSTVELATGAVVTGGTLTTTGDGRILATGTTASIADLTNAGKLVVADSASLGIKGAIVNNGSMSVGQTPGNYTLLALGANATLSGTGEVILTKDNYSQIRGSNANLFRLTNDAGHTIRGFGWLGTDTYGHLAVTNRGTVNADVNAKTLTIDPWNVGDGAADFVNTGLLKASNGGTLAFDNGTFTNAGTIRADSGSTVKMDATGVAITNYDADTDTLTGGQWKALAGAAAAVLNFGTRPVANNAASVTLSGAGSTFAAIDSLANNKAGGEFLVAGGRTFTTTGALANAGLVSVGAGSTVAITGAYTQTAGQTVVDGVLSAPGTTVISGGNVGGSGTFQGDLSLLAGSFLDPGTSPGTFTVDGNLTPAPGCTLLWELGSTVADYDRVNVQGNLILPGHGGASITVHLSNLAGLNPTGQTFTFVTWTGVDPAVGTKWDLDYGTTGWSGGKIEGTDNDGLLGGYYQISGLTPEPTTLALLALGAILVRRRRAV